MGIHDLTHQEFRRISAHFQDVLESIKNIQSHLRILRGGSLDAVCRGGAIKVLVLPIGLCNFRADGPPVCDSRLGIFAGLIIGITAMLAFLRGWTVPPQNANGLAARTREIACGAAALRSTRGWPFWH